MISSLKRWRMATHQLGSVTSTSTTIWMNSRPVQSLPIKESRCKLFFGRAKRAEHTLLTERASGATFLANPYPASVALLARPPELGTGYRYLNNHSLLRQEAAV